MNASVFTATLGQMAFLAILILTGFVLARFKLVPTEGVKILSRLENLLLIPAFVTGTFLNRFTVETLSAAWKIFLGSFLLAGIVIAVSIPCVRLCTKDSFLRRIYLYGLSFSNFGFMGNAVVAALFPEILPEYLIFTMALWILIDLWGVPSLLMGEDAEEKPTVKQRLRKLLNPMFIGMLLGMIVGISGLPVPAFVSGAITSVGDCMSPIAMLITGMTVAQLDFRTVFRTKSIYAVTVLRLLVYPLVFLGIFYFLPLPTVFEACAICSLAMPLGLNTVVVPSAYGRDPTAAASMALVSHLFSCLTIPFIFWLLSLI